MLRVDRVLVGLLLVGVEVSSAADTRFSCSSGPIMSFMCKILRRPSKKPRSTRAPVVASPQTPVVVPPTTVPSNGVLLQPTTFYALGDVPYNASQAVRLQQQMKELPNDAEFVVHVGDLRSAGPTRPCERRQYTEVAALLRTSRVPVFVILGDNDWTDCPNRTEGLRFWQDEFVQFESRYWSHNFAIARQSGRPDNFAFVHKGTLFIGLNIIGGNVHDATEWTTRLTDQVNWTIQQIRSYQTTVLANRVGRVVLFGHANPNTRHDEFFQPLRRFIRDELQNKLPVLYINGDKHEWLYEPNYLAQSAWLRIMVSGLAADLPLKVVVNANGQLLPSPEAFVIDRRL